MEITPHIHAVRIPLGPTPDRFVNVYLVYGNGITVIDTGFAGSEKLIYEDIRATGQDPSDIGLIILTHSHPDHTGAAKAICDLTGCAVAAHSRDAPAIEDIDPILLKSPAPGIPPMVGGPVPIGRILNDGDTINFGKGLTAEVLHTPGHSPGSYLPVSSGRNGPFHRGHGAGTRARTHLHRPVRTGPVDPKAQRDSWHQALPPITRLTSGGRCNVPAS